MKWCEDWFSEAKKRVVAGQGKDVAQEMESIERAQIPRRFLAEFARLYRRTGNPLNGVKTLFSAVKGEASHASSEEIVEYACCLSRLGRGKEAIHLLQRVPESGRIPFALEIADIHFNAWDYRSGELLLARALEVEPDGYRKRILQINHLSCLVALEQYDEAMELGGVLSENLKKEKSQKLLGNCLELLGQVSMKAGDWCRAKQLLQESIALLKPSGSLSSMLPEKWMAIGEMMFGSPSKGEALSGINIIKGKARKYRHWESLRHIDLQVALHFEDSDLFSLIYQTCPHENFVKLFLDPHKDRFQLSRHVRWSQGERPLKIELSEPLQGLSSKSLEPRQVLHKVLVGLFSDYYSPITIYQLHLNAFAGEHFDPISTTDKTYKAIKRLRHFLAEAYPDLALENNKEFGYRIRCERGLSLVYPDLGQRSFSTTADFHFISELKNKFGSRPFNRKEVDEELGYNSRKSGRKLLQAVESGDLICSGSGRNTTYKLAS